LNPDTPTQVVKDPTNFHFPVGLEAATYTESVKAQLYLILAFHLTPFFYQASLCPHRKHPVNTSNKRLSLSPRHTYLSVRTPHRHLTNPMPEGPRTFFNFQENPLTAIVTPTQERLKERPKGQEGTRQTRASPVYQKHRLLPPRL